VADLEKKLQRHGTDLSNEEDVSLKVSLGFFLAIMGGQIRVANKLINHDSALKMMIVKVMQDHE
jgi:hypothetical protein